MRTIDFLFRVIVVAVAIVLIYPPLQFVILVIGGVFIVFRKSHLWIYPGLLSIMVIRFADMTLMTSKSLDSTVSQWVVHIMTEPRHLLWIIFGAILFATVGRWINLVITYLTSQTGCPRESQEIAAFIIFVALLVVLVGLPAVIGLINVQHWVVETFASGLEGMKASEVAYLLGVVAGVPTFMAWVTIRAQRLFSLENRTRLQKE